MSFAMRTEYCFPMARSLPGLGEFQPEPDHKACPGEHVIKGVLGGWHCVCPCHQNKGSE